MSIDRSNPQSFVRMSGFIIFLILLLLPVACKASTLTVAISPDLPPYVMNQATGGIEVAIIRKALPDRNLHFIAMPYAELQTAIPDKRADIALGVQQFSDDGVFYSDNFVTFENAAITKKTSDLKIDTIDDLTNHTVLAWQDAYLELGPDFKRLFSPGSPNRKNYVEIGDQHEQVQKFWDAQDDIIVIDRTVFIYFSAELGHSSGEAVFHSLFVPVTNFKVGFKDAALRDVFNQGLIRLCESGGYAKVLKGFHVEFQRTVCDH